MEDLLTIEARLTDVRYELESAASQLKLYDSLVSYSTVYLTIEEVQKLTPVQEQSTWERISTGFWENLQIFGARASELPDFPGDRIALLDSSGAAGVPVLLPRAPPPEGQSRPASEGHSAQRPAGDMIQMR